MLSVQLSPLPAIDGCITRFRGSGDARIVQWGSVFDPFARACYRVAPFIPSPSLRLGCVVFGWLFWPGVVGNTAKVRYRGAWRTVALPTTQTLWGYNPAGYITVSPFRLNVFCVGWETYRAVEHLGALVPAFLDVILESIRIQRLEELEATQELGRH